MTSQACEEQCDSGQMGQMVRLDQAVGLVLANDVTEIIPGKSKGPAFRKGHIVSAGDLQRLARLGKRHLYVLDIPPGHLHENDAAELMANALGGVGVIKAGPPVEGKITLVAQRDGLFEVDTRRLQLFNMVRPFWPVRRRKSKVVGLTVHRRRRPVQLRGDDVYRLVNLITAQRAYEINSRAIKAGDDMLQTATQLFR